MDLVHNFMIQITLNDCKNQLQKRCNSWIFLDCQPTPKLLSLGDHGTVGGDERDAPITGCFGTIHRCLGLI